MIGADDTLISQGLYGYNAIFSDIGTRSLSNKSYMATGYRGYTCSCLITLFFID
ncbi:hypothetical protein OK016_20075 [Vibrio chagasii]|nr:hypothetical protein [Vibrio chagasii]